MSRWLVLALVVLALPTGGCLDAFLAYAELQPSPPSLLVLYSDLTRFGAEDAPNGTVTGPPSDQPWRREAHVFEAPGDASNLSVHVDADLALPPPGDVRHVQDVHVELFGPRGEHEETRFTVTGERSWTFPGDASGRWLITVEGRGWGDVHIAAAARGAPT